MQKQNTTHFRRKTKVTEMKNTGMRMQKSHSLRSVLTLDKLKYFQKTVKSLKQQKAVVKIGLAFWVTKFFVSSWIYMWISYSKKATAFFWLVLNLYLSETKASTKGSQRSGNRPTDTRWTRTYHAILDCSFPSKCHLNESWQVYLKLSYPQERNCRI